MISGFMHNVLHLWYYYHDDLDGFSVREAAGPSSTPGVVIV